MSGKLSVILLGVLSHSSMILRKDGEKKMFLGHSDGAVYHK